MNVDKDLKKILIIGANGFLGYNILFFQNISYYLQKFKFFGADLINTNLGQDIPFYKIDITNNRNTINKIVEISPDIVILTAALTDVNQNEVDKEIATKINTEGPKNVLKACEKIGSKLVFISTDFIFDGVSKNGNYNENDLPNPLSHYGKTKYEAELAIKHSEIDFLICRTAVLYGWNREKLNFITWILNKLERKENISIVTRQINNPTFVKNLAEIILKLIEKDAKGIYNTAGTVSLSRYEMALKCAEIFNFNVDLITPVDNIKQRAIRPENAGLNISKLKKSIGSELHIFSLDDGLNYMKNHPNTLKKK